MNIELTDSRYAKEKKQFYTEKIILTNAVNSTLNIDVTDHVVKYIPATRSSFAIFSEDPNVHNLVSNRTVCTVTKQLGCESMWNVV